MHGLNMAHVLRHFSDGLPNIVGSGNPGGKPWRRSRIVLVEFEPGHVPGLAFFSMEAELSALLGRKVDLNTPGFLSRYFRDRVLAEAENQYVAA